MNCCSNNCNQGRACPARVARVRRAAPLHIEDGGHTFRDGIAFPTLDEPADEPLHTPGDLSAWAVFGQIALLAFAVTCVVMWLVSVIAPLLLP